MQSYRFILPLLVVFVAGCTAVRPQEAFEDVQATVAPRIEYRVAWRTGAAEDAAAQAAVDSLLAAPLTPGTSVQVALLNNRRLQATYEDLGVAQAQLVQAGLLANPVFGGRALWALEEGGAPDLGFNIAFEFLDVFYLPLRKAVARDEYAATRHRVAEAVLDLSARTRIAFYQAQAAEARLAMQQRIAENAAAAYEAARLLREAGNTPATDLLAEQARYEQARLDVLVAQNEAVERREALTRLLGLYGPAAAFELAGELPPVPSEASGVLLQDTLGLAALEREAVENSLALAAVRHEIDAYARRLGLAGAESLLPELEAGGELEREEGEWEAGPEVEIVLPLLDQGQARRAVARAELRRRQALYYDVAVQVRSAARTMAQRLATTRRVALHYQEVVLPLRAELVQQTLLQYNAMQTGVFGLLQAQQMEADAARGYYDALATYWTARTDLEALLHGRMPALEGGGLSLPTGATPSREAGH